MTETTTIRDKVLAGKPVREQMLLINVAEALDSIKNGRMGSVDPVEDWLFDAAQVLTALVRDWDETFPGDQP